MFKSVAYSIKGGRSEENEDAYISIAHEGFYLVADGVGGGPNGKDASRIVVGEFLKFVNEKPNGFQIIKAIEAANDKIRNVTEKSGGKGMASTVAALHIDGEIAVVFNVGDSRVYKISEDSIEQLSTDHSRIFENDQKSKNVITSAVGARDKVDVEVNSYPFKTGDWFLLVSDGISDAVVDSRIMDVVISGGASMLDKCTTLANDAENGGGRDDKTIILVATHAPISA